MKCHHLVAVLAVCSLPSVAEPIPDSLMWEITPTGNSDGTKVPAAQQTKMPWCPAKFEGTPWPIADFKENIRKHNDFEAWADAAEHLCEQREDLTWIKQATYLVQKWMNANNLTQAAAEKEIADQIVALKEKRSPAGQARLEEEKFAFAPDELEPIAPEAGVEKAKIGDKPAWCDAVGPFAPADRLGHREIGRTVGGRYGIEGTVKGAFHICQRPTDTTWKQFAQLILQKWMNWTRLTQADAEKSLRARLQADRFAEQRTSLCKTLVSPEEAGGEEKTFADARRQLFGCTNEGQLLWQDAPNLNTGGVGYYLDAETQTDPLMRVYWLFGYLRDPEGKTFPGKSPGDNLNLLYYALAQADVAKVDAAEIDKLLSVEPYNEYARIAMMETVSIIKSRARIYEQAVAKFTKGDADLTAILVAAPKSGWAQWDKALKQWGPEIERSNAFEKLLSQPSRKVLKGCSVELTKDAQKVIKSYKVDIYKDLIDKISSDPVANVLLRRVSWCYAADKVIGGSGALRDVVQQGRNLSGPRSLVYYAIVDAIADAKKDRPRLLLDYANFSLTGSVLAGTTNFNENEFDFTGSAPREWDRSEDQGQVASVKKVEDGLQVDFKKVIATWPDQDCVDDTRHPLKISSDGRIVYYQFCKPNGRTVRQDNTPRTIVISPLLANGVKPGVFLRFTALEKSSKGGKALAVVGYTKGKATDKKINSFLGFDL